MPYTFAIIGGGLTGTSMLCQLVDKLCHKGEEGRRLSQELSIIIFEKQDIFGPGLPHNEQYVLPFHITNMCAEDMSVRCDKPNDFQEWVQRHAESTKNMRADLVPVHVAADHSGRLCHHYPRALMGDYLRSQFTGSVETARNLGITVRLFPNSEVIDLCEDNDKICLTIRSKSSRAPASCRLDGVLLATGHWFEHSNTHNYFSSPWPASSLLAAIPSREKIGVIGSSLSAIEVGLTLTSDGRYARKKSGELIYIPSDSTRKITFYSRNGLLPRVRGRLGKRPNIYLTGTIINRLINDNPGQLTLSSIFELLDRELTAAYGSRTDWQQILSPTEDTVKLLRSDIQDAKRGDGPDGELVWQTLLFEIFPVIRELYLNLTLPEREWFDRRFSTLFFMHAATQPVINAEKLLALMQAGIISIVKLGNDYRFECDDASGHFEFIYTNSQGNTQRDLYQYVVNASGQPRSIESDPAELTQNLLKRELVQIKEKQEVGSVQSYSYMTGSILIDPLTCQVVQPRANLTAKPDPQLFAVGAMTRGQVINASMAIGISRSTAVIAEKLIAQLHNCKDQ